MLMLARLTFAPRAFLQIFITTTLHHRLAGFGSYPFRINLVTIDSCGVARKNT
jgi:hypothetical protein